MGTIVQLWRGPVENYLLAVFFMQLSKSETRIHITCLPFTIYETRLVSARVSVDDHRMHIFTANIPTFHTIYRRYVPITNELYKFY
jgi:hypothetical protein